MIETPEQILINAVAKYNSSKFILAYSGGRDSTTTLDITKKAMKSLGLKQELILMYWNTGINLKENVEFVHDKANKEGLKLIELKPEKHFNYESLTERFGFLSVGGHRMALGFLKWFGFRKYAKEHKLDNILYLSGRRLDESKARTKMISNLPYDRPESNMNFCSPIFYISNDIRNTYMDRNNLKASPCYDTAHIDGNCSCGCYSTTDEKQMYYIFHEDTFNQIKKLEDRYGGERWSKILDENEIYCFHCKNIKMIKSKTRFLDGIHHYYYWCARCYNSYWIKDEDMSYHMGYKDNGYWGNGNDSCNDIIINVPDKLICHGCKTAFEAKQRLKKNNAKR